MDLDEVQRFLDDRRTKVPDALQQDFIRVEELWKQKLWHQLTELLVDIFKSPHSVTLRLDLYQNFVNAFADKINQFRFVSLGLLASEECSDGQQRLAFLVTLADKVDNPASQDAHVYALSACANARLASGDLVGARKDLERAQTILDLFDSVEADIHASFYEVNSNYFKANAEYGAYYRNALLYLACIDTASLSISDAQTKAYDLSIAALLSDSIYQFGELLLHPIMTTLVSSPNSWLRDFIFAFSRGDLTSYHNLEPQISKIPLLDKARTFLYQKISLAALTEAIFRRPPHNRAMSFRTISQETNVAPAEIEILIMKALSLGLVKGTIDQVAGIAQIDWVQPKVLDLAQVDSMRRRLLEWDGTVSELGHWVEGIGRDVWAA